MIIVQTIKKIERKQRVVLKEVEEEEKEPKDENRQDKLEKIIGQKEEKSKNRLFY